MRQISTLLFVALAIAIGTCSSAWAVTLANPGFETPSTFPGVEYAGAPGWTPFGAVFTVNSAVTPPHSGDQSLKMFGGVSGVFQDFPASPGQLWDGGAWVKNDALDPMAGGQVAAVNIEWLRADLSQISFISNGDTTAATDNEWHLRPVSGVAPNDTAFARLVLITGAFLPGGPGGAPKYDDAFFGVRVPEPTSIALAGLALCGVLGLGRRKRA